MLDPLLAAQLRHAATAAIDGKRPSGRPAGDAARKQLALPGTNRRLWRLGPVTLYYATSSLAPDVIDGEWARDDEVYLVAGIGGAAEKLGELVSVAYAGLPYPSELYVERLEAALDRLRVRISQRGGQATARIPYIHPRMGAGPAKAVMHVGVARATPADYAAYGAAPNNSATA